MASKKNDNEIPKEEILTLTHLTSKELKKIKYTEIMQAYNLFVSALKFEPENLRNKEHFWVLGIDSKGYIVCVYTVSFGSSNVTMFAPAEIFQYAMQKNCIQVIFAHNHTDVSSDEVIKPSKHDLETTNWLFHAARYLGIQLLDHLIINLHTFCSMHKIGEMQNIIEDMTFKTYDEIKPKLDDEKAEAVKVGVDNRNIEIAQKMLSDSEDISKIVKYTELTIKEIEKIEKDMQIDLVKKMLRLSANELDEIVKISKLSKKEVLKIKKDMSL